MKMYLYDYLQEISSIHILLYRVNHTANLK